MALAKWYKIDFHTHTPESKCFPDKKVTPKEWLKSAKESGINAVVVSDHNSVGWISKIEEVKSEFEDENFKVFYGIELCVSSDFTHFLIIFDDKMSVTEIEDAVVSNLGLLRKDWADTTINVSEDRLKTLCTELREKIFVIPAHFASNKGLGKSAENAIKKYQEFLLFSAVEVRNEEDVREYNNKLKNKAINKAVLITGSDNPSNRDEAQHSYVFVDEAHRFRNSSTEAFTELHQICRGKKVILISATPINNYTSDVENQIYLFQAKQSGTINGIKNIEGFFRGLNAKLAKKPKGSAAYMEQLRENSEIIRDKLIREVMIRRTRSEIQQYYADDLAKQGLTFPKAGSPEKIIYSFDEETDDAFSQTINIIKDFKYARYTPLLYLKDKKKYATMLAAQHNMGGFMKGILVKRLESSFYAFRKTLDRFIESYEKFIEMSKTGKIYISKKVNVYDLLDDGNTQKLMYLIEQQDVMEFEAKEFSSQFFRDLQADLAQLKSMQFIWSLIETDPKLDEFKSNLTTNPKMKGKKAIVFTESTETAQYLYEELKEIYGERIIYFSGQSSAALKVEIEDSFNPKFKDKNNDKYDLLITTDVLAEGINLHRANVLVNYDLPWNPTRIMQRVGRINRVGTEYDRIYVFNFFPTAQSKKQMPLEERILEKLQAFHDTLGEDFKYLSDEEEVSSKKLFSDLTSDLDSEEESTNPELAYLAIIRQIRDNDPKLFSLIKRLPKKAKAGKDSEKVTGDSTITFIRQGALKTFFLSDEAETKQLSFMQAIDLIKAEPDDEKVSVSSRFYEQFDSNSDAFDQMLVAEEEVSMEKVMVAGNDAKIIRLLKAMKTEPRLTDDQEQIIDKLIMLWENGEIPAKVSKDVMKKSKVVGDVLGLYYEILKLVPPTYFEERKNQKAQVDGKKQIVLSCYLKTGGTR